MVHSPSVGPIRIPLWSPLEHMLSVTTPVNLRWPWALPGTVASADTTSRLKISRFIVAVRLVARRHQVGTGCARVHDPHAAARTGFRQSEGLGGRARNGDGHV